MYETSLLLIGTVTSASQSDSFVSENIAPGPAEIVQKYLISGLDSAGLKSVEVITAPRIPAYPKVKMRNRNSPHETPPDPWAGSHRPN